MRYKGPGEQHNNANTTLPIHKQPWWLAAVGLSTMGAALGCLEVQAGQELVGLLEFKASVLHHHHAPCQLACSLCCLRMLCVRGCGVTVTTKWGAVHALLHALATPAHHMLC